MPQPVSSENIALIKWQCLLVGSLHKSVQHLIGAFFKYYKIGKCSLTTQLLVDD